MKMQIFIVTSIYTNKSIFECVYDSDLRICRVVYSSPLDEYQLVLMRRSDSGTNTWLEYGSISRL